MTIHDILRSTPDLSPSEKLILSILASHSGRKGACWPAQGTIAKEAGLTRKTVWTALKRLESLGLVKSEHRTRQDGGETSKVYRICEVSAPPLCNGYTPPCEIVTHHEKKRYKNKKRRKNNNSTPGWFPDPPAQNLTSRKAFRQRPGGGLHIEVRASNHHRRKALRRKDRSQPSCQGGWPAPGPSRNPRIV